jgi:hypothetical protein
MAAMAKWKQISGDVNWADYGVVLAKDDKDQKSVELVRIEPWIEHDSSAIKTHGLYVVEGRSVDYGDMGVDEDDVKSAIESTGMDEREYKKLSPAHKAEIIASYNGYGGYSGDERSTNNLLGALPDKPENIEFWHGKETEDSVKEANREMRKAGLEKAFDTRLDFGEVPEKKALDFAWGDEENITFEIDDNEASGLGYAKLFAHSLNALVGFDPRTNRLTIDNAKDFALAVEKLAKAPKGEGMGSGDLFKVKHYLGHPENIGEGEEETEHLREMATEMAESAHELAINLMGQLGFDWS